MQGRAAPVGSTTDGVDQLVCLVLVLWALRGPSSESSRGLLADLAGAYETVHQPDRHLVFFELERPTDSAQLSIILLHSCSGRCAQYWGGPFGTSTLI